MASGHELGRRYRRLEIGIVACAVAGGVALALLLQAIAGNRALDDVRASANEALALQSETLSGILEKYRLLPPLLSRRDDIAAVFDGPWAAENRAAGRAKAIEVAGLSGAKDVAFADAEGRIFASARGIFDRSSFQDSTLFEAAGQGRLGREAMSLDENDRAYVFASAVRNGSDLKGAIAVYVPLDKIEATWSLSTNPIVVTRADGEVFLANRNGWHLRDLVGDDDAVMRATGTDDTIFTVAGGGRVVEASRELPLLGWTLHVFADYAPVAEARRTAVLLAVLVAALAGIVAWFFLKRREALIMRLRRDKASALRLERLVRDRTSELTETNTSLAREVGIRARTETQLRRTQKELVQAAKLAVLGQMSATLSHEYNQPLAAIRTYGDNAQKFLASGKTKAVSEALERIDHLVGRMSDLSRTLLSFSRKPGTAISDVQLGPIIDEALMLAGPRAKKAGVSICREGFDAPIVVRGGRVRLTQVVVNLLNNAVDALTGIGSERAADQPEIRIKVEQGEGHIDLVIEDNGPGVGARERERVFEPFYSTKGVGEGLGIGLSIVHNIVNDLGATITVEEGAEGGARFAVRLAKADISAPVPVMAGDTGS